MSALAVPIINNPLVIKARCHYCQKERSPFEIITMSAKVRMCWHCYEWHHKALKAFAGEIPDGCQGCGRKYVDLEAMSAGGDVKFAFVPKDGIYQILCVLFCSHSYVEKRAELFKGTRYGSQVLKV